MSGRHLQSGIAAALACALLHACADAGAHKTYSQNARENFDKGEEAFKDGAFQEAVDYFNQVKNKFPYSKYAVAAELRAADSLYEDEKYIEAADAYRLFAKLHPTNEKTAYAMFRVGLCHHKQVPRDWFFMPPVHEEDQTQVKATIEAMQQFLLRFADSPDAKEARTVVAACRERLAQHELYVAQFYFKRERFKAAQQRAEGLLKIYAGLGLDDTAMLIVAKSLLGQARGAEARAALEKLVTEFPKSRAAAEARDLLAESR
ncbi:MAG: outer membrane protein assembly factor BamD [Deltaproteobacteria bacterium]|nr:outer membrane protein assembly factor BamD [Deltaproteobacteria bacterium]